MITPHGFERVRTDRAFVLVRSDTRQWLVPLLTCAGDEREGDPARALSGGRGGTVMVQAAGHQVVLRPCRRGGLPARFFRETYFGLQLRPFRELCTLETLRQRGVPVVEVLGACVRWVMPGCYRGWIATRYVPGARTLWEWATAVAGSAERPAVWRQVGVTIRRLHEVGARHPDLNLRNILLCPPVQAPSVLLLDFDQPRAAALFSHAAGRDLARLRRSARKLDPDGRHVTPADLEQLMAGYQEAGR